MNIQEQFNLIAEEYDRNRRKFIPCYEDYYITTTDFIASNIKEPKKVVDLGTGTGLLSYYWYQKFPKAEYILSDIASDMLDIAKRRFDGLENFEFRLENYIEKLPDEDFDAAISALSIHHLNDDEKQRLFQRIYDHLPNGGLLANYDQFCADDPEIENWYNSYWEGRLQESGLNNRDIELWKERRKADKECSVEKEVKMLLDCGFSTVKCVYCCQKFAVIVALK